MGKTNKSFRIRTNVNEDSVVNINFDQTFDKLEILSLTLNQTNAYRLMESNTGIVAGRVLANGGFGVPNAKLSVFVPYDGDDDIKKKILYHYVTVRGVDYNGVKYNLLPSKTDDACHQNVGTFPSKRILLDNQDWIEVFDKYYKYTTKTNNAGDYMIYGVPTGMQTVHMDVDLSDIGMLSQTPRDMMYKGYSENLFDSPTKFKKDTNLNSLVQIISQDSTVYVHPFWGDTTNTNTNAAITRCDINVDYKFEPTCIFMGSVVTDTGENSMSKKCVAAKNQGKMSDLVTGEGKIEMIRKTPDNKVEQYSVNGDKVINSDGVWCYQIPMNLDYITTDEFGNTVLSDNPEKGIPTRTRVRFRLSMSESPGDGVARKRARYLIPNNPRLVEDDYPKFYESKLVDYEFGSKTKDENFRDLLWNNVYSVKNYIPRLQKSRLPDNLRHLGFKTVNRPQSNNPIPFNNLSIKFNFTYKFMCTLSKVLITIVRVINTIITGISSGFLNIASLLIRISNAKLLPEKIGLIFASIIDGEEKTPTKWAEDKGGDYEARYSVKYDGNDIKSVSMPTAYYMLGRICANVDDDNTWSFNTEDRYGIGGLASFFLVLVYNIGCGITLSGMCTTDDGVELMATPGTNDNIKEAFRESNCGIACDDNVAKLYNCIENQLAQDNEVTSFNFYNDWLNGVVYLPLWYRKIKPKRKFLWWSLNAKDQYCANDNTIRPAGQYKKNLKLYNTMVPKRTVTSRRDSMGSLNPLPDDEPTSVASANRETGTETIIFKRKDESNCYGYRCHDKSRMYQHVSTGVIYEKETMLGDRVQYYKPVYYNNAQNVDTITLFATDIILLGSLRTYGLFTSPQFFRGLVGTTYNMPPDLMVEDYEYINELGDVQTQDNQDNESINKDTRSTEITGADWGNIGCDQSNTNQTTITNLFQTDANTNKYDNGGLFYGITCFDSYTKPKSCINLARICEFGVSLDETQDILKSGSVTENSTDDDINNLYETLTPDGFVSYDEIYDMDYRSMFATLNGNFLKTRLNPNTGLTEYDFNHLYVDNFDGSMSLLMKSATVNGTTEKSNYTHTANYTGNYNLEKTSDAYLNFRYGNYEKMNRNKIYFYEYDKVIGLANSLNGLIKSGNKQARYENSFYFYFGLKEGKTAVDVFNTEFFSDCVTDGEAESAYDIQMYPNSWCPIGSVDGCIVFDCNMDLPISLTLTDKDNPEQTYSVININKTKFYIGTLPGAASSAYARCTVHDNLANTYLTQGSCVPNGRYNVSIVDGNGIIHSDEIRFIAESLTYNLDVRSFNCKNIELNEMFGVRTNEGDLDMGATFRNIATYGFVQQQDMNHIVGYPRLERSVYGYIAVSGVSVERFILTIEPSNPGFFTNSTDRGAEPLYKGAKITVCDGDVVCSSSDLSRSNYGYLGEIDGVYYFGVPYGGQRYKVSVTQFCGDVPEDCTSPVMTGNTVTRTVTVLEGTFKMFVNTIDYDLIMNFKTGWSENNRLNDMGSDTFSEYGLYGWNDMDNIGYYNSGDSINPSKTPIDYVEYTDSPGDLVKVGLFLCDDYKGNGSSHYPFVFDRSVTTLSVDDDYSTPYTWFGRYCYNSEKWAIDSELITKQLSCTYTNDNNETTTISLNRSITNGLAVYYDGDNNRIADEDEYGIITFMVVSGGVYSDFQGATFLEYKRVVDDMNDIINNRIEFTRLMMGVFRINKDEKTLSLGYSSNDTPIKYQIAGNSEVVRLSLPMPMQSITLQNNGFYVGRPYVLDAFNMEENNLTFTLPTLTYVVDGGNERYKPYERPAGSEKHPYYVAIQNNVKTTLPAKSNTTQSSSLTMVVDNFGIHKTNPYTCRMFGVHFYDKPMYVELTKIFNPIVNMPKYGLTMDTQEISIDGFICGYAYNGVPKVQPTLSLGDTIYGLSLNRNSNDSQTNTRTKRVIYSDDSVYGVYQHDRDNDAVSQYGLIPRITSELVLSDGYGDDYTLNVDTTNAIDFSDTVFMNAHYTHANSTIEDDYLTLSLKNGGGATYYIYKYDGNHILDNIRYNEDENRYYFENMPELLSADVDQLSYDAKTTSSSYNIGRLMVGRGERNKFFVMAINGVTRMISPVFDLVMGRMISNFYSGDRNSHSEDVVKNVVYITERVDNKYYSQQSLPQPTADINNLYYLSRYGFDLDFTVYNNDSGVYDSVYTMTLNPEDFEIVNITIEDWYTDASNNQQWFTYEANAIKITLTDFEVEEWHHTFATEVIGLRKVCAKQSNCYVSENTQQT